MAEISTAEFDLSEAERVTEAAYREKLAEFPANTLSLVKRGGETVGWLHPDIPDNPLYSCFIFIYITPEHRRNGVGTAVYREAEVKMKASGLNWWTSYPELSAADSFAMSVGFDYTNTNLFFQREGGIIGMSDDSIRPYEDSDFPTAPDIWGREYAEMHRRIGLPYERKAETEAEFENRRREYHDNRGQYYVLEIDGNIIGIGALYNDNSGIGALAVDYTHAGKGYGTRLAAFITDECIRRGCEKPSMYCELGNDNALHIYKKLGYREASRETVAVKN